MLDFKKTNGSLKVGKLENTKKAMTNYPIVPGRGLNTKDAKKYRLDFLNKNGIEVPHLADSRLDDQIRHNIESYIGSVEIPIGLAGPLLFNEKTTSDYVYAPAGTLEGALVASMNRGAKVVSKSGGFNAVVVHQRMVRSPMFLFRNLEECVIFKKWVEKNFEGIKNIAEQYSNHADLKTISPFIASRSVHLKFIYSTGDASGQNMTTTCTSHAIQWVNENFQKECGIKPVQFVIEGNGASDKKVSHYSINQGRGIHVIAECELSDREIEKVLRVKSEDIVRGLNLSKTMSRLDGMIGYNINITNVLAAIFVATGQDLASIHESGVGILNIEKTERGMYCSLHLPTLVIGTVGGGTQLLRQNEALRMMDCAGTGKVERFAKLIAGFALALEVSTLAAIVGGQFAKVHEKLGRNKPVNWLVKSEINKTFLEKNLKQFYREKLSSVDFLKKDLVENGLIINLTSRVNNKLTGFVPLEVIWNNSKNSIPKKETVLLKSKPLDIEVFQGLHYMAASIDPNLADLLSSHQNFLEYKNCHLKETKLYRLLDKKEMQVMPQFYGSYKHPKREIYTLIIEMLDYSKLGIFNAENHPEHWTPSTIKSVIRTINEVHNVFSNLEKDELPAEIKIFEPWKAKALYFKFAKIISLEYEDEEWHELALKLFSYIENLEEFHEQINIPKTIVHNDFNSRNLAIREGGEVCIYDWELAVLNFPHRDIVEFLSFALPLDFDKNLLLEYLKYHFELQSTSLTWQEWERGYLYSLQEFLVTRVTFYMTGKILMNYQFAERVFLNAFRMIDILSKENKD